jgi:hypothetical protein
LKYLIILTHEKKKKKERLLHGQVRINQKNAVQASLELSTRMLSPCSNDKKDKISLSERKEQKKGRESGVG